MCTLFPEETKGIIEALLFVTNEPLAVKTIAEIIGCTNEEILYFLGEIRADCERERRGYFLQEIAGGYLFITRAEYAPYLERLLKPRLNTLTPAALETLAIIAYQQPVTKSKIDELRGVNSDSALNTLLGRVLIAEKGRQDGPGRPILYGTTPEFLKYLGLKDLQELPPVE